MKKIMISCGLRGKPDPVTYRDMCEKKVMERYGENNAEIVHANGGKNHQVVNNFNSGRIAGLGFNIQNELAVCDEVVFMDDWQNYDGCRCEHFIASQYGIPCFYLTTEKKQEKEERFHFTCTCGYSFYCASHELSGYSSERCLDGKTWADAICPDCNKKVSIEVKNKC